jgi:nicotinate-nucleotide adenylyltransferase
MIGVLGGTFDPVHFGHLRMGQELAQDLGLNEVRFIPAATPPHREAPHASALHRAEMVRLAIAGNPLFALDTREFERDGPSYMVDTLTSLRAEVGQETPLYLLLGADAFLGLPGWHRWRELFGLANIVVAHRPGFVLDAEMVPELRSEWQLRYADQPVREPCGRIILQEITALDISASAIRNNIWQHQSIRYLLPEAVNDYIQSHHLYQKESHGT